jgi:hypothetical protein
MTVRRGDRLRTLLRGSHFPVEAAPISDPDGNVVYVHLS